MKFVEPGPFSDPDATARRLVEIANAIEPAHEQNQRVVKGE